MSSGRISLLISKELQTVVAVMRGLDKDVAKQLRQHTRTVAEPVWKEAVRGNVTTRMQTTVLSDTARAAVSDTNITLRSGGVGKTSSGTSNTTLVAGTEFGADPNKMIQTRSRKGTPYMRRRGRQFPLPRRGGYVVFPAAREVIPRIAALWVQTTVRAVHEAFEKAGHRG